MGENGRHQRYLEFSCESIELNVKAGEVAEASFHIYADYRYAEGRIYSSDTRMRLLDVEFKGEESEIGYCFDALTAEAGNTIKGEFDIISNCKEYTIPYKINVQKPQLTSSIGNIKNMFHFTNLAQTSWNEAVDLFYSPDFSSLFHRSDKNAWLSYVGLSKNKGNEQNVEEFLIEISKKTPIVYHFDIEGFLLEDVQDSTQRQIVVTRSGWGYSFLRISVEGDFLSTDREVLESCDFDNNKCNLIIYVDAAKLHNGVNSGSVMLHDACNAYTIPFDIMMEDEPGKRDRDRKEKHVLCDMVRAYVDMLFEKKTRHEWVAVFEENSDILSELDEDNVQFLLYHTHLLLEKERTNEAKWYLDTLEERLVKENAPAQTKGYYLYLTTFLNQDKEYIERVCGQIEGAYEESPGNWQLAWFLLQLKEELLIDCGQRWKLIEQMYDNGCTSPLMFCEAVLLLQEHPTFLIKLGDFEEKVLWFGAKNQQLMPELIDQIQYLETRKDTYSNLLLRTLYEVYYTYKSPQTIASICHMLILGDKKGSGYYCWYALGVEYAVRVTKLYEYYMMSLELDKYGDIREKSLEIPKMVLMYFAYQSTLDYELNAFLYAYIVKNREKYPDLEPSYRIAIERFVLEQVRLGHINENLAYLYKRVLSEQMITEDTAFAFAPLLFMHRIYVDNPNVKSIVVIHEKVNGESSYPVADNICMIPIYGSEYKLFLQDENGCRFTKSIHYENKQLMEPEKQISYISGYMQGRLSFDVYMCEVDKNYVTITPENVRRFKNLAESGQVVEGFKREIRTKLLKFYYDNDMIGELDVFLEETPADGMDSVERAEFIRYMVSRGMFEKAYYWIKTYGVSGVSPKAVARLISKRIISREYEYEAFLVNVAYYIYRNMKYDENILRYLVRNYEGRVVSLKKLWKSARELELDTGSIMYRILKQIKYTGVSLAERDEILLEYADYPNHDILLVNEVLMDTAYEYFVEEAVVEPAVLDRLYQEFGAGLAATRACKLALLKFWSENPKRLEQIQPETVIDMLTEFLHDELYFPFYKKLTAYAPQLHYIKNCTFVEYRTVPGNPVYIHYVYGTDYGNEYGDILEQNPAPKEHDGTNPACIEDHERYETVQMREMFDGIHVSMFQIFQGEAVQYYITEMVSEDGEGMQEHITQSDTLYSDTKVDGQEGDRFGILNDMLVSIGMQEEATATKTLEEYMYQDFCSRELFRVL